MNSWFLHVVSDRTVLGKYKKILSKVHPCDALMVIKKTKGVRIYLLLRLKDIFAQTGWGIYSTEMCWIPPWRVCCSRAVYGAAVRTSHVMLFHLTSYELIIHILYFSLNHPAIFWFSCFQSFFFSSGLSSSSSFTLVSVFWISLFLNVLQFFKGFIQNSASFMFLKTYKHLINYVKENFPKAVTACYSLTTLLQKPT